MKLIKRLGAIVTAIAVMLTVGSVSAFADPPTGYLTINGLDGLPKNTSTFVAYQLITCNASLQGNKTIYTDLKLNQNYRDIIINGIKAVDSNFSSTTDNAIFNAIQNLTAGQSEKFAAALKTTLPSTADKSTNTGTFDSLQYGYYLVAETAHDGSDGSLISDPFLVCIPQDDANPTASTVKVKTSTAKVEKKIVVPGTPEKLVDSSTAAIGDTVEYQAVSTIPTYSDSDTNITYSLTDTLSKGLDYNSIDADGVTIIDGNKKQVGVPLVYGQDYILETDPTKINNATFQLTLKGDNNIKKWGNAGYRLKIRYSAKLNDSAKYGETGNPNSINLTYSIRDGSTTTDDDTVITYTYRLVVTKTDNTDQHKLAGATFQLQKKQGSTWKNIGAPQDTSSTQGDVFGTTAFTHLEQGDYQLVEVTAPAGYNLCAPIQFTVAATNKDSTGSHKIPDDQFFVTEIGNQKAADNVKATWDMPKSSGNFTFNMTKDELDVTIADTPGFVLPGTGGIGTTIFAVSGIGILLIGGCLALLYFRKKRSSER